MLFYMCVNFLLNTRFKIILGLKHFTAISSTTCTVVGNPNPFLSRFEAGFHFAYLQNMMLFFVVMRGF